MPIIVTTDGSCYPNNGQGNGGWAAVIRQGDAVDQLYGHERHTTNNRMEFMAVLRALEGLPAGSEVLVRTDSEYVMKACMIWWRTWEKKRWRTSDGKPVKNQDLITAIVDQTKRLHVKWNWVRGHNGDEDNETCDRLAAKARQQRL